MVSDSHTGQSSGGWIGRARSGEALVSTRTISGITSPARRTSTTSPICRSRSSINFRLCRVARRTVTPPTKTGAKCATGVTAPVRPTSKPNIQQLGLNFLGRKLMRDRPMRCPRILAQTLLQPSSRRLYKPPHQSRTAGAPGHGNFLNSKQNIGPSR